MVATPCSSSLDFFFCSLVHIFEFFNLVYFIDNIGLNTVLLEGFPLLLFSFKPSVTSKQSNEKVVYKRDQLVELSRI